jgi:hypothetical protein
MSTEMRFSNAIGALVADNTKHHDRRSARHRLASGNLVDVTALSGSVRRNQGT